jgi:ribosomal protein S18 acetylase RimI-like enzyme
MIRAVSATDDCEAALAAHWSQLGRLSGGTLHDQEGLLWFETPVRGLPYNGVVRTRLTDDGAAGRAIERVLGRIRERHADVWWAVHPSATPASLGERLAAAGLRPVEAMNFMALDLDGWQPPPAPDGVRFEIVADEEARRAYTELTYDYWEVEPEDREPVARLHREILERRLPGEPFLAHLGGRPVGKAYLSRPGPPGVASLYGMSVRPEARGRGVALALSAAMVARAQEHGCRRMVLHATDMAVGVYARLGFRRCGSADVYATAALWSDKH